MENFVLVQCWLPLDVIDFASLKYQFKWRNQDNNINYSRPFVKEFLFLFHTILTATTPGVECPATSYSQQFLKEGKLWVRF